MSETDTNTTKKRISQRKVPKPLASARVPIRSRAQCLAEANFAKLMEELKEAVALREQRLKIKQDKKAAEGLAPKKDLLDKIVISSTRKRKSEQDDREPVNHKEPKRLPSETKKPPLSGYGQGKANTTTATTTSASLTDAFSREFEVPEQKLKPEYLTKALLPVMEQLQKASLDEILSSDALEALTKTMVFKVMDSLKELQSKGFQQKNPVLEQIPQTASSTNAPSQVPYATRDKIYALPRSLRDIDPNTRLYGLVTDTEIPFNYDLYRKVLSIIAHPLSDRSSFAGAASFLKDYHVMLVQRMEILLLEALELHRQLQSGNKPDSYIVSPVSKLSLIVKAYYYDGSIEKKESKNKTLNIYWEISSEGIRVGMTITSLEERLNLVKVPGSILFHVMEFSIQEPSLTWSARNQFGLNIELFTRLFILRMGPVHGFESLCLFYFASDQKENNALQVKLPKFGLIHDAKKFTPISGDELENLLSDWIRRLITMLLLLFGNLDNAQKYMEIGCHQIVAWATHQVQFIRSNGKTDSLFVASDNRDMGVSLLHVPSPNEGRVGDMLDRLVEATEFQDRASALGMWCNVVMFFNKSVLSRLVGEEKFDEYVQKCLEFIRHMIDTLKPKVVFAFGLRPSKALESRFSLIHDRSQYTGNRIRAMSSFTFLERNYQEKQFKFIGDSRIVYSMHGGMGNYHDQDSLNPMVHAACFCLFQSIRLEIADIGPVIEFNKNVIERKFYGPEYIRFKEIVAARARAALSMKKLLEVELPEDCEEDESTEHHSIGSAARNLMRLFNAAREQFELDEDLCHLKQILVRVMQEKKFFTGMNASITINYEEIVEKFALFDDDDGSLTAKSATNILTQCRRSFMHGLNEFVSDDRSFLRLSNVREKERGEMYREAYVAYMEIQAPPEYIFPIFPIIGQKLTRRDGLWLSYLESLGEALQEEGSLQLFECDRTVNEAHPTPKCNRLYLSSTKWMAERIATRVRNSQNAYKIHPCPSDFTGKNPLYSKDEILSGERRIYDVHYKPLKAVGAPFSLTVEEFRTQPRFSMWATIIPIMEELEII